MFKSTTLALVALWALSGCTTAPKIEYRYQHNKIPEELMVECQVSEPMDINKFMALNEYEQLEQSLRLNINLTEDMNDCNSQWRRLRQWNTEQTQALGK